MSDLQERLRTAGNLARLQAVINLTRAPSPSLTAWPSAERLWFAQMLSPFAVESDQQRQLTASSSASSSVPSPPISELIEELRRAQGSGPSGIQDAFKAIVQLVGKLLAEQPEFEQDEIERVRRIASSIRRRLLHEQSFQQPTGSLSHSKIA